jgi:predicted alpha/beta superfamily hydrolase
MHDGQNLFDEQTSFAGEWEVDETLNALYNETGKVPVVVGIDNGGEQRINEYSPWVNQQYGGGEGDSYMNFIVETLKPYIDEHYRTNPGRTSTAIMGSSLGGLISHYGAVKHQDIFSKAGIFSPSYWFSDSVYLFTQNTGKQEDIRFYLMCGDNEGETTVQDMLNMAETLKAAGFNDEDILTDVIAGGQHNEKLWRDQFKKAVQWLFQSWLNSVNEIKSFENINIFPNPVDKLVQFPKEITYGTNDSLTITDVTGRTLVEISSFKGESIPVCGLEAGVYFVTIRTANTVYTGEFIKN